VGLQVIGKAVDVMPEPTGGPDQSAWSCAARATSERAAVITEHARAEVERYLAVGFDDAAALFPSYSRARKGQRLTVRGAEDACARRGVAHRVTNSIPTGFGTRRDDCAGRTG
jgi:hypothetical protein